MPFLAASPSSHFFQASVPLSDTMFLWRLSGAPLSLGGVFFGLPIVFDPSRVISKPLPEYSGRSLVYPVTGD